MKIHVYAALKEYFTPPEFELAEPIRNTDELKVCLLAINATAGEILNTCKFAVEDGFIGNDFKLKEYDTVIIVPPGS